VVNLNRGIGKVIPQVLLLMNKGGKDLRYLRIITLSERLVQKNKGKKGQKRKCLCVN